MKVTVSALLVMLGGIKRGLEKGSMSRTSAGNVISTILRHDDKQTSYKIALLRSINDVVLNFPTLETHGRDVAVPVSMLADFWIAYYWAFTKPGAPILQGPRARLKGELRNDMAFRPQLEALQEEWLRVHGSFSPSDGFFLKNEMRIDRKRKALPAALTLKYRTVRKTVGRTIRMPIKYAGPGHWSIFPKPQRLSKLPGQPVALPRTKGNQACLLIKADLWESFKRLSLWIEALCVHEWCLFTETVEQNGEEPADRGEVYRLLTDRPESRIALTWERNRIDVMLMEGYSCTCPWTEKTISSPADYHLDHLLPLSIYPINELWNLIPADPMFNANTKRDRLPSTDRLTSARHHLSRTYELYTGEPELYTALSNDVALRFSDLDVTRADFPAKVASAATQFVDRIAESRNLARF